MSRSLLSLPFLGLLLIASCKKNGASPQAGAQYDVLAQQQGRWVWDGTSTQTGNLTPASKGFTRQLVFQNDSTVLILRNGTQYASGPFRRSSGPLPRCGAPGTVPIIEFANEGDMFNNDRKTYRLTTTNSVRQLLIIGESACVDGGTYETFHWEAKK